MIILNQFPGHCDRINSLYGTDESFRELCEDYILCQETLKKVNSMEEISESYLNELAETDQELKEEIRNKIGD